MHGGRGITGGVDVDLRTTSAVRPRTKGCTPYDTSSFFKRVLYSRYGTVTRYQNETRFVRPLLWMPQAMLTKMRY
jgi:hypothetical protein